MPATKQGGGYTLTFSKKNQDAKEILDKIKQEDKVKVTDYICECVRFYEKNKNKVSSRSSVIDEEKIKDIVEKHVMDILINSNIAIKNDTKEEFEPNLEENLDEVDIDED